MERISEADRKLSEALRLEEVSDPAPTMPWEAIRRRAASLPHRRHALGWRWWLALGVIGTCLSGTAVAVASPEAAGTVQQVLAGIHALPVRDVTLAQARADAGYGIVQPTGLPAGTQLKAIDELPALGAAPAQFLFKYRAAAGPFAVAEGPAGGPRGGAGFYVVSVAGRQAVFAGQVAPPPAPAGAIAGTAVTPRGAPQCPSGAPCTVQVIGAGAPGSGGPVRITCPAGRTCSVQSRNGHEMVTVGPVGAGGVGPTPPGPLVTRASWTVGSTEIHLINPGTLTQPQVEAIRASTTGS